MNTIELPEEISEIRYEKYGEDFDESSLSEEELEALDLISDNDPTGLHRLFKKAK